LASPGRVCASPALCSAGASVLLASVLLGCAEGFAVFSSALGCFFSVSPAPGWLAPACSLLGGADLPAACPGWAVGAVGVLPGCAALGCAVVVCPDGVVLGCAVVAGLVCPDGVVVGCAAVVGVVCPGCVV